jgi:hypothetical protein
LVWSPTGGGSAADITARGIVAMPSRLICQNGDAKSHPHIGALRAIRYDGVLSTVLNLFVALAGPTGATVYVAPSQIVAIIDSPNVGACPTTLITMSQSLYGPAEVKRKLEAAISSGLPRSLGDASVPERTE